MPQHASRVLKDAYKYAHFRCLILDRRTCVPILNTEQLPELTKARETPVTLLGNETMVCV